MPLPSRTVSHRDLARLATIAAALALVVVVLGAFVRLSNAGLSCPDWPLCYGRVTWPSEPHEIDAANARFPERPVEHDKAWREQVHRIVAGMLVLGTFALAAIAFLRRREPGVPWRAALAVAALIVLQALLGMWTVTLGLLPIIVTAHLAGGMTTLALLVWIAARSSGAGAARGLRSSAVLATLAIVAVQIVLGGWTSANYAALACGADYPACLGALWPPADFREGFVLVRTIGVDYEGGVLDARARTAIHLAHRTFAIIAALALAALGVHALRMHRLLGALLIGGAALQVSLGIATVLRAMPLAIATAHNAMAALLVALLAFALARAAA